MKEIIDKNEHIIVHYIPYLLTIHCYLFIFIYYLSTFEASE